MMALARETESSPGHRVLVHKCQCGAWASFGRGVKLRQALDARDIRLAGDWTCGPDGCRLAGDSPLATEGGAA